MIERIRWVRRLRYAGDVRGDEGDMEPVEGVTDEEIRESVWEADGWEVLGLMRWVSSCCTMDWRFEDVT